MQTNHRCYASRREFAPRGSSRFEKSFATEEIWGQYNNYRSNGLVGSRLVHIVVVGLVLVGATFSHQIVQQATQREIVTLIAPPRRIPTLCNPTRR